jgi:DnaJ-class molecular chaperone
MVSMNYYEILGVPKDASQEEVRRAYKRCALRYHPDKMQDNDAAMFKKVNEAYQILGDIERRKTYDELVKEPSPEFWYVMNMLLSMMKQYIKTQVKKQLVFDINVNLAEIYRGEIKKLVITTKKRDGTEIQKNIYISLKGIKTRHVFEGAGDETIDGSHQDIIVNVIIIEDKRITRDCILDTLDLNIELPMTLYEYYAGFEREIEHLDGELLHVHVPPKSLRSSCQVSCFSDYVIIHVLEDKGLPDDDGKRGKLYVYFRLVLPETIPLDVLKNIT